MTLAVLLITCTFFGFRSGAVTFSSNGRYIPKIKIAEEIDIRDVTFTTPSPDSDHLHSLTNPKVITGPRIVVPVVTFHKVTHPVPELLGLSPGASYEKRSYVRKPKKYKYIKHGKGHKKLVYLPTKYRYYQHPPKAARPVYYLLGDDHASDAGGYMGEVNSAEKYPENLKLYNEKDLQFLKSSKKLQYPKKYSFNMKNNHKNKPEPEDNGSSEEILHLQDAENTNAHTTEHHADDLQNGGGDRVEFQMYGMDGPNSYKFGYDTGKGDNRHFRFEERDSDGKIRGHYGYMDNDGKMRIMKYEADPETGFHAGPVDYPEDESNNQ